MRVRDAGEFGLIERLRRRAERHAPSGAGVLLGIGDDAAVLRPRAGTDLVLSCDAAVEGVHFDWARSSAQWVGRRTALACLSDLAAMGARPQSALLALAVPGTLDVRTIETCFDGLCREAARVGAPVVGGNVTRSPVASLALTVTGSVPRGRALRRDAARPGDTVCVTGVLGAAGLAFLEAERLRRPLRHLPPSRIGAGVALAGLRGRGACIDLSDGLASDLAHVLEASGVGAEVEAERLPLPRGFARRCRALGVDPVRTAVGSGEDYELLFTVRRGAPDAATLSRRLGAPVTAIGRIVRGRGLRGLPGRGFRHF